MPPLRYWLMRTLRRNTPQRLVDAMLDRGIYLRAGRDTTASAESVAAYSESAARYGMSLAGQRICVVGSGGGFGIGIHLLEAGARQVILQEPFAPERTWRNKKYLDPKLAEKYFEIHGDRWQPRDERLLLVRDRLEDLAAAEPASVDIICSSSVLEHVTGVPSLVAAMAKLMHPAGLGVHFVDLRDHYFRYPFEMLCYTKATWDRWLNASNTLNRLRRNEYEQNFRDNFREVRIDTMLSLPEEFARAKSRILPEHLTGDDEVDATGIIRVEVRNPIGGQG